MGLPQTLNPVAVFCKDSCRGNRRDNRKMPPSTTNLRLLSLVDTLHKKTAFFRNIGAYITRTVLCANVYLNLPKPPFIAGVLQTLY